MKPVKVTSIPDKEDAELLKGKSASYIRGYNQVKRRGESKCAK